MQESGIFFFALTLFPSVSALYSLHDSAQNLWGSFELLPLGDHVNNVSFRF